MNPAGTPLKAFQLVLLGRREIREDEYTELYRPGFVA